MLKLIKDINPVEHEQPGMRKVKRFCGVILFFILSLSVFYAEAEVSKNNLTVIEDSLCKELETIPKDSLFFSKISAIEMLFMDSSRFLRYAEMKEQEARKLDFQKFVCESYSDRAIYYSNRKDIDSFYYWKNKMDPIALELKEFNYYFYLTNVEVRLLVSKSLIEKAGQVAKQTYETAKKYNSIDGMVSSNISLGTAMQSAKKHKEAMVAYEQALALIPRMSTRNNSWKLSVYASLILCSDVCKEYLKGLDYASQVDSLLTDMQQRQVGSNAQSLFFITKWAELRLQKSYFYVKLEDYPNALRELKEMKPLYSQLPTNRKMGYHMGLCDYYTAVGQYDKALAEYNIGAPFFDTNYPSERPELLQRKATLKEKLGAPSEALGLYKQLISLKDSINNAWFDSQLNELRTIYEVDHLQVQNQELEIKNKHNQLVMAFLLIGLMIIALTIISVLYYRLSKVTKALEKSQALLMAEKDQLVRSKEELRIAKERAVEARDLALKAERKESFFANMSHEIRTPLNAIVGFSNLLVEEDELSKEERYLFINTINQNCEQLLKLVNDVLNLSRMESDKMQFIFGDFNLTEIVSEIYSTHQMMIPDRVEFLKEVPTVPAFAHVDKGRLKQVLSNFINNAVKFTYKGYIKVGYDLNLEERQIVLFVEDTGRGIPEEHQKKIFERFYKQVDTDQGTGLGLSICSVIAEKLGGRLKLESEEGKGSRFSIILSYSENLNQRN